MASMYYDSDITDDEYEDFSEFDEYMESLSDVEREAEEKWVEAIALAIMQGKNAVPCYSTTSEFRM